MKVFQSLLLAVLILPIFSMDVLAASAEQRLLVLERKFKALSNLSVRLGTIQRENQQLRGEIEVLNHAVNALKKRQRQLYLDLDSRVGGVPATTGSRANKAIEPSTSRAPFTPRSTPKSVNDTGQSEQKIYQKAFALLMQRRYKESANGFSQFLRNHPNGKYADNAQYWLAEAKYAQRQFDGALQNFAIVISKYPSSPKVADALLKTGFIFYEKKQWEKARQYLTKVVKYHSKTTASRLAKERLVKMKMAGH